MAREQAFRDDNERRNRQTGAALGVRANTTTIVRDRYGASWRAEMEATTAKVAAHCLAAHGPVWWGRRGLIALEEGKAGGVEFTNRDRPGVRLKPKG